MQKQMVRNRPRFVFDENDKNAVREMYTALKPGTNKRAITIKQIAQKFNVSKTVIYRLLQNMELIRLKGKKGLKPKTKAKPRAKDDLAIVNAVLKLPEAGIDSEVKQAVERFSQFMMKKGVSHISLDTQSGNVEISFYKKVSLNILGKG